ncbi:MAG: (2Fe-2S)-binding protein [candidate division Zixibacteria bacterium]|nr:(2Fe-2S)-binding protein [candidate division Zixibacteria bacterium]
MITPIGCKINGNYIKRVAPAHFTLLRFLREVEGLTGTKCGCEIGECGACTVIMDGKAVNSCLVLAPEINGKEIWTIESLSSGFELHPIQKAFIDHDAVHCGYCTPGLIMTTVALLNENSEPTEMEIKEYIAGNLCRCTGYVPVIKAIENAAILIKEYPRPLFK